MRLTVHRSTRNGVLMAELPECLGFFDSKITHLLEVGKQYDFIIVGYSNKNTALTGLPSAVFLDLVQPGDRLVFVPTLSKRDGEVSSYDPSLGTIYPSHTNAVWVNDHDEADEHKLPRYPRIDANMWIRFMNGKWVAHGVNSYADIAPCIVRRPQLALTHRVRESFKRIQRLYAQKEPAFIMRVLPSIRIGVEYYIPGEK